MKRNSKIAHMVNRSTVAIFLVIMMIISSFSAIAVTSDIFKSSASKDVETSNSSLVNYESGYVYFLNTSDWTTPYCYAWNSSNTNQKNHDWPGIAMTDTGQTYKQHKIYKIAVKSNLNKVIFNVGNDRSKTNDLDKTSQRVYYFSTGKWVDIQAKSDESTFDVPADTSITNNDNLFPVTAKYYDYLSDAELQKGWLNTDHIGTGFNGSDDNWYPDKDFNKYVVKALADKNSSWLYPLYFGNFCNTNGAYDSSNHNGDYNSVTSSENVTRFNYIANNSNGLSDYHQSVQGLAYPKLDGDGNIQVVDGLKMPYFDDNYLLSVDTPDGSSEDSYAKILNSVFPFRKTTVTSNGKTVDTYEFDSSQATDNVYFNWNDNKPVSVAYGAGKSNGVIDGYRDFMNPNDSSSDEEDPYGIFPFNNRNHELNIPDDEIWVKTNENDFCFWAWADGGTGSWVEPYATENGFCKFKSDSLGNKTNVIFCKWQNLDDGKLSGDTKVVYGTAYNQSGSTYNSSSDENLDFGFGIRMDIDFRVPEGGVLPNGEDVTFEYSGDDDLWVYISDDSGNENLVLDLGGDHKMATGNINFNTMQATADDVFANYGTVDVDVPSDEVWVKTNENDFCFWAWADGGTGSWVEPYATENGFCKFKSDSLGNKTNVIFCKWQNLDDGKLSGDTTVTYGNAYEQDGSSLKGATGKVVTSFNGGKQLDPNKTYHMTVFYMERGTLESNLKVAFTMTPVTNELVVDNKVLTDNIYDTRLQRIVESLDNFPYTSGHKENIEDNNYSSSGVKYDYTKTDYTKDDISQSTDKDVDSSDGSFNLQSRDSASFNSQFESADYLNITEGTTGNKLSYSTTWSVVNNKNQSSSSGTGKTAEFQFGTEKKSNQSYHVSFVNSVVTYPLTVSKNILDDNDNVITDEDKTKFNFRVLIDSNFDGKFDETEEAYDLKYYTTDNSELADASRGVVSGVLTNTKSVTVLGIPDGMNYEIKEIDIPDGYVCSSISSNGNSTTINNKKQSATATLSVYKTLDGTTYKADENTNKKFEFTAVEVNSNAKQEGYNYSSTTDTAKDGKFSFKSITYSSVGTHYYKITETVKNSQDAENHTYQMDPSNIYARVNVYIDDSDKALKTAVSYLKLSGTPSNLEEETFTNSASAQTFANTTTKGKVTVTKTDQLDDNGNAIGKKIAGATFTLYKSSVSDENKLADAQTNDDGVVVFEDLDVYDSKGEYINYVVKETVAPSGYVLTNAEFSFNFEGASYNDATETQLGYFSKSGAIVNVPITIPSAGEVYSNNYVIYGSVFIAISMFGGLVYYLYVRKHSKKQRAERFLNYKH